MVEWKTPEIIKDYRVLGSNPCLEISLENFEFCNLSECFLPNNETFEEFKETLKFAYLYCKTITLLPTEHTRTNEVQMRNRRLGVSVSGVVDSFNKHGMRKTIEWLNKGYKYLEELDKMYSEWFKVGRSIKISTIKPSGSVSLLAAVSPGVQLSS